MKIPAIFLSILVLTPLLLGRCDRWSVDSYWRDGHYVLVAVDTKGQMSLMFDESNESLVDATVFFVGSNARFVVLKQHPKTDSFGKFDRAITNYFVVERNSNPSIVVQRKGVLGPLNKAGFEKLESTLGLPKFSTTFKDLE